MLARLNIRIDARLLEWVRWWAIQNRTTVTAVIIGLLERAKRDFERRGGADDAPQL